MSQINKIQELRAEYPTELQQLAVPALSVTRHPECESPYEQPLEPSPLDLLHLVLKLKREVNSLKDSLRTVVNNLNKPLHLGGYDTPSPYDCGVKR